MLIFSPYFFLRSVLCDYFIFHEDLPLIEIIPSLHVVLRVQGCKQYNIGAIVCPEERVSGSYNIVTYTSTQCYPGPGASDGYRASPISHHPSLDRSDTLCCPLSQFKERSLWSLFPTFGFVDKNIQQ